MATVEFVHGQESHSSNWGKFYIKGLEPYQVREDHQGELHDNHHNYTGYDAVNIPEGILFTVFEQNGNKRGTDTFIFAICITTNEQVSEWETEYGNGFCKGNYKEIVRADSLTKAPRLMGWWIDSPEKTLEMAEWMAECINKRGLRDLPPLRKVSPLEDRQVTKKRQQLEAKIAKLEDQLNGFRQQLANL
jgi:hypothetical protein